MSSNIIVVAAASLSLLCHVCHKVEVHSFKINDLSREWRALIYTRDKVGQEVVTLELIEVAQITEHVNNASTANALIVNK